MTRTPSLTRTLTRSPALLPAALLAPGLLPCERPLSPDVPLLPGRSPKLGHRCLTCGPFSRWAVVLVALTVLRGDAVPATPCVRLSPESRAPSPSLGTPGVCQSTNGCANVFTREDSVCARGRGARGDVRPSGSLLGEATRPGGSAGGLRRAPPPQKAPALPLRRVGLCGDRRGARRLAAPPDRPPAGGGAVSGAGPLTHSPPRSPVLTCTHPRRPAVGSPAWQGSRGLLATAGCQLWTDLSSKERPLPRVGLTLGGLCDRTSRWTELENTDTHEHALHARIHFHVC